MHPHWLDQWYPEINDNKVHLEKIPIREVYLRYCYLIHGHGKLCETCSEKFLCFTIKMCDGKCSSCKHDKVECHSRCLGEYTSYGEKIA